MKIGVFKFLFYLAKSNGQVNQYLKTCIKIFVLPVTIVDQVIESNVESLRF